MQGAGGKEMETPALDRVSVVQGPHIKEHWKGGHLTGEG